MKGRILPAALGICSAVWAAAAAAPPQASPRALQACAEIGEDRERLACYDRLAGHASGADAGQTLAAPPSVPVAAPGAAQPVAASAGAAKESFGLYAAEHPAPPPAAPSVVARIEALSHSADGRATVTLEGGQVWELDAADPLLAIGDTVRIRRAALGSFLLETPTKRTHRAHRLH